MQADLGLRFPLTESVDTVVCRGTKNVLIRLHRCAQWSGPTLSAKCISALFVCCISCASEMLLMHIHKFPWRNKKSSIWIPSQISAAMYEVSQGPVIQSIVSLMSLLMTNALTVVAKAFSNTLIFLLQKSE